MPDYPQAAMDAAETAIRAEMKASREIEPASLARAALDAAAPLIAESVAQAERRKCIEEINAYANEVLTPLMGSVYRDAARLLEPGHGIAVARASGMARAAAVPSSAGEAAAYLTIDCHRCGYSGTDRAYEDQGDGTWLCSACPAPEGEQ